MIVSYDIQAFLRQRRGGISKYFAELIGAFDMYPEMHVIPETSFQLTNNLHIRDNLTSRKMRVLPSIIPRLALYGPWWLRGGPPIKHADIVHYNYYSSRFLKRKPKLKNVVSVYDMIPEIMQGSQDFTGSHLDKKKFVEAADLVICISESTRNDLLSFYGPIKAEVKVIPLAVSSNYKPVRGKLPGWPSEYLLYVGARKGYKDFNTLLAALAVLRNQNEGIPLIVIGQPFSRVEKQTICDLDLTEFIMHAHLTDAQLIVAYSQASALVQTSKYEGFGLSPLEAMACGTPVIVANSSSMPEVGGDVAQYFVAGQSSDLAEAIRTVLSDSELRSRLSLLGIERAKGFSVKKMAQRTAEAYATILEPSSWA